MGSNGRIVAVLPIDEDNNIILVKQFRPGQLSDIATGYFGLEHLGLL